MLLLCRPRRRAKQLLRRGPGVGVVLSMLPLPPPCRLLRWADQIGQCQGGSTCCSRQARCTDCGCTSGGCGRPPVSHCLQSYCTTAGFARRVGCSRCHGAGRLGLLVCGPEPADAVLRRHAHRAAVLHGTSCPAAHAQRRQGQHRRRVCSGGGRLEEGAKRAAGAHGRSQRPRRAAHLRG